MILLLFSNERRDNFIDFLKQISLSRDFCCWSNSLFQSLGPRDLLLRFYVMYYCLCFSITSWSSFIVVSFLLLTLQIFHPFFYCDFEQLVCRFISAKNKVSLHFWFTVRTDILYANCALKKLLLGLKLKYMTTRMEDGEKEVERT